MARLNTHTSATPLQSRATTVDSLYRDPTPAARGSTARNSSYSVMSPALSQSSDKENDLPESRQNTPPPPSKRGLMAGTRAQRLPTPDSASTSNPNKRRRTTKYDSSTSEPRGGTAAGLGIYEDGQGEGDEEDDAEGDDSFEQSLPTPTDAEGEDAEGEEEAEESGLPTPEDDDDDPDMRYYNPHQDPRKRRQIRSNYRNLQRELEDNRDEYIKPNSNRLNELVPQATRVFGKVRMTADAVLDSHFLTSVTDFSSKQLKNSVNQGNHGIGVDLDQFVSRCIFFMKEGRPPGAEEEAQPSSRGPRQIQVDEADEEADGDGDGEGLDWAYLGRHACFPSNSRPPLSSFLLGPLSVQKRVRNTTRRARAQRQPAGPATRPQEIKLSEMEKSESSNLTYQVKTVGEQLKTHINKASELVTDELDLLTNDPTDDEMEGACRRHRVCALENKEAAVSLFDFAINPHSFGQTVENLFYISFLIREGAAKVEMDADGLPLLAPEASTADQRREQNVEVQRRQAVFSIDYATWQTLIEAFDIQEPLIPHREPEQTNIGASGWYS